MSQRNPCHVANVTHVTHRRLLESKFYTEDPEGVKYMTWELLIVAGKMRFHTLGLTHKLRRKMVMGLGFQ